MAHVLKYLKEIDQFYLPCFCPVGKNMILQLIYDTKEDCIMANERLRNAKDHSHRFLIMLIEMESRPYKLSTIDEAFSVEYAGWFGVN